MEKKLEDISDVELKAMAYDTLAQLQALQQNLNIINAELSKRAAAARENNSGGTIPQTPLGNFQTT